MEQTPGRPELGRLLTRRSFWAVAMALALVTTFHYLVRNVPLPGVTVFLSRHAVDRILFILPIAGASYFFGCSGGLITLALALVLMIPRVIWISSHPVDAALEAVAVGMVGAVAVWMIEARDREKRGRQMMLEKVEIASGIASTASQSLSLDEILEKGLAKVLEGGRALGLLEAEPRGSIFLLGQGGQRLHLKAQQGLSSQAALRMVEAYATWLVGRVAGGRLQRSLRWVRAGRRWQRFGLLCFCAVEGQGAGAGDHGAWSAQRAADRRG